jgi:glucose-1-phosphate adenylyltransferase
VFSTDMLIDAVCRDAANPWSRHDVGGNIMPALVERGEVAVYDFAENEIPGSKPAGQTYWRDVGDLDSYYRASMDLLGEQPAFDLFNTAWPIHGWLPSPLLPARLSCDAAGRNSSVADALLGPGVVVTGASVRHSVVAHNVRIRSNAVVEDSVLMSGTEVGEGAVIRGAIIDKDVLIPPGARIEPGSHPAGAKLSPRGVVALGKAATLLPGRSLTVA